MDLALEHSDLDIVNGDIALCSTNDAAIMQAIAMRLKTLSGEWLLDTSVGLPYFSDVFGYKRSERYLRQLIAAEISSLIGIKAVNDVDVKIDAHRHANISFTASLSNGTSFTINEMIGR